MVAGNAVHTVMFRTWKAHLETIFGSLLITLHLSINHGAMNVVQASDIFTFGYWAMQTSDEAIDIAMRSAELGSTRYCNKQIHFNKTRTRFLSVVVLDIGYCIRKAARLRMFYIDGRCGVVQFLTEAGRQFSGIVWSIGATCYEWNSVWMRRSGCSPTGDILMTAKERSRVEF